MARFTVICYVLFGLSNLRVTLLLATLSVEAEGGLGESLEPVVRGWPSVLRLHSSANRGIFVRFLFENKTFHDLSTRPPPPGWVERGWELSGLVSSDV